MFHKSQVIPNHADRLIKLTPSHLCCATATFEVSGRVADLCRRLLGGLLLKEEEDVGEEVQCSDRSSQATFLQRDQGSSFIDILPTLIVALFRPMLLHSHELYLLGAVVLLLVPLAVLVLRVVVRAVIAPAKQYVSIKRRP